MPFSLSNTHTVVADDIFLLQNINLKNIYDIFATIEQLDNVTGFDQATIDILINIANTMGGLPSTWYTDLVNSINLKRNITDSYSITYINSNFYNSAYINANYYDKDYINNLPTGGGGNGEHQFLKCQVLEFKNFSNPPANTLSIVGSDNINIKDSSNNSLMDFSQFIVEVIPPFKCYSSAQILGSLTAPNIYDKTNVDQLLLSKENVITGGASTITTTNLTGNRVLISSNTGKVGVSTVSNTELDFIIGVNSGIQGQLDNKISTTALNDYYTSTYIDNNYYNKSYIDNIETQINNTPFD